MPSESRQMYVGGARVGSRDGRQFEVRNPATGEVCFTVADAGREDVAQAVSAAQSAQAGWAALPHTARAEYLNRAADIMLRRQQELAGVLTTEGGSWVGKAMFEVAFSANILRVAAASLYNSVGEVMPSEYGKLTLVVRKPVGVVAVISPWNFPLLLSMRAVAAALAPGNAVVLKPSEETPVGGGLMIADVFAEAGFPDGVFNAVTCSRERVAETGDELVSNDGVSAVSFTGSTAVGRGIGAKAGGLLKKASLELGGKDPLIVLGDADLERAVDAAVFGSFMHQGQICMSVERIIVDDSIHDELVRRLTERARALGIGDPSNPGNVIGPVINERQRDRIHTQVSEAGAQGAVIHTGGEYEGLFYRPTVISGVTRDMRLFREETFGPVAAVISARNDEEAVELANDSEYGLSAGIITRDEKRGLAIAAQLQAGMAHINDCPVLDEPHLPFGGVKSSGLGRHGGRWGIEAFTQPHWISLDRGGRHYPF